MHRKPLSSSYYVIVILKQLVSFVRGSFPTNVFHGMTMITDALKRITHDQNGQTIGWAVNLEKIMGYGIF